MQALKDDIIEHYTENSTATQINKQIRQYFVDLPASTSTLDPQRLGTQSQFISRLRYELLELVGPLDINLKDKDLKDAQKFNHMDAKTQLAF